MSMKKHARSGHNVNCNHFTGIKKKKGTKRKQKLTMKQKKSKQRTHINKFKEVA